MELKVENNMDRKKKTNSEKSELPKPIEEESGTTIPEDDICQKAPEWAEHSRLHDEDEPCDDGRTGNLDRNPRRD